MIDATIDSTIDATTDANDAPHNFDWIELIRMCRDR